MGSMVSFCDPPSSWECWFEGKYAEGRNALFHEIIDPLDEEWQVIFKNAYLVLKEIVDLNISEIENFDKE